MQELQRLEAKNAELSHVVTETETDLERLQSRLENHKKQVEKIEKTTIPPLERDIASLQVDIGRLQEEIGTELTQSLSDQNRQLLNELKQAQADLAPQIEAQNDKVAQAGVERQKLLSLLEDNLRKRRRELTEVVAGGDGEEGSRRASRGRLSTAAVQAQRKEDLEDLERQLGDAAHMKDDIESRIEKARGVEEVLRGELIAAKNELEQLKSQDMKNVKALEEAQDKSERLLNKVRLKDDSGSGRSHPG